MSSSVTITDEMVAEIANRMAEEGQKVSPVAIWSEVHSGSVVAVAAALRKWRETRALRAPQVAERAALPEVVTDTMRDALDRLWTAAQDEAERGVNRRLLTLSQRLEDASNERDDALAELQSTVEELETGRRQLFEMTEASRAKADGAERLAEEITQAMAHADAAELRAQELEQRVAALEAELERLGAELADEREARTRLAAELEAALAAASEAAAAAAAAAEAEPAPSANELAQAEAVGRLESELAAIRAVLESEQQAHAARTEEAAGARAGLDAAQRELQEAQTQLASLAEAHSAGASEIERLSTDLSAAQERADVAELRAAELAQAQTAVAGESADAADAAPPAAADAQELEALKLQIARDAEAHAAALAEARTNMKKWSEYANGLKQQLTQVTEKMIVMNARATGEASLARRLASELSQLQPEHELLRREAQQQLITDSISTQLEQQGYRYNAQTGAVSKAGAEGQSQAA
ncbi:ATPase [Trinickia terrae]|uniref:ATPase n=1 Tax=Trinickia terrae TaxID=2571161 RepID=A0A4U1HBB4_9BURK|nr:DNA-binding protein [Trinickia terrae]TKC78079.1 ATPase [Trinickia terrae]